MTTETFAWRKTPKYKYELTRSYIFEIPELHGWVDTPIEIRDSLGRLMVNLSIDGTLFIQKGYCWDGASGPTFDTQSSMRASLIHDALYQICRQPKVSVLLRKIIKAVGDGLLQKLMIEDGAWKWRAKLWRWAVSTFGSRHASPPTLP